MLASSTKAVLKYSEKGDGSITDYPVCMTELRNGLYYRTVSDGTKPGPSSFRRELIVSERNRGTSRFNNCVHLKETQIARGTERTAQTRVYHADGHAYLYDMAPIGYGSKHVENRWDQRIPSIHDESHREYVAPLSRDQLENCLNHAARTMKPTIDQFTQEFSLLNFLYELKDIPQMFSLWSKDANLLANQSGLVVNHALGYKPFIADCERMFNIFYMFLERVKEWNRKARKGTIMSRHCELTQYAVDQGYFAPSTSLTTNTKCITVPLGSYLDGEYGDFYTWYNHHEASKTTMHAHMYFKPKVIRTREPEDQMSIWLDALGGGDGASIIWNAIPFSFVVDWFWDFGKFLENFQLDAVEMGFDIVDFGYSFKEQYHSVTQPYAGHGREFNKLCLGNLGSLEYSSTKYLRRKTAYPVGAFHELEWQGLWTFHLPSWHNAWIGTNLLVCIFAGQKTITRN